MKLQQLFTLNGYLDRTSKLYWDIKSKDRLKDYLESPQTVQSSLETATNHNYIDTASELISETKNKYNDSIRNAKQKKKSLKNLTKFNITLTSLS